MIFLKGLILGFSIAAPVGPIGLLCINKTLQKGKLSGFLSGMGAASADMIYGSIAAFGLTAVSGFLLKEAFIIKFIGGLFMCCLGISTFIGKKSIKAVDFCSNSLLKDYFSTFLLTITNPMTILAFTAVFAGLGIINADKSLTSSSLLILGVFLGSALWWLLLSFGVGFIAGKSNELFISIVNKISGVIIFVFGVFALI